MKKLTRFQQIVALIAIWIVVTSMMEINFALRGETQLALVMTAIISAVFYFGAAVVVYWLRSAFRR